MFKLGADWSVYTGFLVLLENREIKGMWFLQRETLDFLNNVFLSKATGVIRMPPHIFLPDPGFLKIACGSVGPQRPQAYLRKYKGSALPAVRAPWFPYLPSTPKSQFLHLSDPGFLKQCFLKQCRGCIIIMYP